MANVLNGNTVYVDSTGTLTSAPTRVHYIILTATGNNSILALQDETTSANKVNLREVTAGMSQVFDFSANPLYFPTGVKVSTLTNAIVTVIYSK
jgi:hypothetical protein